MTFAVCIQVFFIDNVIAFAVVAVVVVVVVVVVVIVAVAVVRSNQKFVNRRRKRRSTKICFNFSISSKKFVVLKKSKRQIKIVMTQFRSDDDETMILKKLNLGATDGTWANV